MHKYEAGQVYGEMTLVRRVPGKGWLCRCSCGTEKTVQSDRLRTGHTVSCGHVRNAKTQARSLRHGFTQRGKKRPSAYHVWQGITQRCNNPNAPTYERYGGRGITVCAEWSTFAGFYADMGDRPEGLTLDRVDNDGPYAKWNCRWATRGEQMRNTRRTRILAFRGRAECLLDWAVLFGVDRNTVYKWVGRLGDEEGMRYLYEKYGWRCITTEECYVDPDA